MIRTGLIILSFSAALSAATVTYTDRSTWLSNVTLLSNYDGGTGALGSEFDCHTASGLILTDLQIIGYENAANWLRRVTPTDPAPAWYQWGSGSFLRSQDKSAVNTVSIRINFTTAVNSFGFNYGTGGWNGVVFGPASSVTIAPQGLSSTNVTTNAMPAFTFYGVTSDTQTFSYVDLILNDSNRYIVLDDIARGNFTASEPPPSEALEPGTFLQMGLGGVLLLLARRRFGWA